MTRTKRVLTMLTVLALTVALAAPALALGEIDTTKTGSIELKVAEEAYRNDFAAQDPAVLIDVLVYKLANVSANGVFTPTERFEALAEDANWNGGILGNELMDVKALQAAAEELVYGAPEAPAEGVEPTDPEAERKPVLDADFTASIDAAGGSIDLAAEGRGLGLYLLIPQKTETALWVYTFSPVMLAVPSVPTRAADPEGGIPAEGDWLYDVSLDLKAEQERRLTSIIIDKILPEYNATLGPTTFLFEVTAELDGRTVYSNVVGLTFNGPGTQSVTVEGIPVGAHVTVEEVYTGGSYDVAGGQALVDIPELPLPEGENYMRVPFTNTYTNERIPDGSVVNRYVYDGIGWDYEGEADR